MILVCHPPHGSVSPPHMAMFHILYETLMCDYCHSDLAGNPIQCTCSALFLRQFLLSQQLGGPLCDGPEEFRRKYLLDLGTEEFCG